MADVKITELTELASPALADMLEIVDDVAGTPTSKKVTLENFFKSLGVGSDADGDMYYRASGKLARLAKGTANFKKFMNAAGTAPEWASGHKIIVSTRAPDAGSGTVDYTGFGFRPSLIRVDFGIDNSAYLGWSITDGTTHRMFCDSRAGVAGTYYVVPGTMVYAYDSGAYQNASFSSFLSDGLRLEWVKAGTPPFGTITLVFTAWR